jgi:hypothetical protein
MTILLQGQVFSPEALCAHNKIVIPTGANPDFLLRGTHQRPRVRLSVRKAA